MITPLVDLTCKAAFSLFFAIISFTLFAMKCELTTTPFITMHKTHFMPFTSHSHTTPT